MRYLAIKVTTAHKNQLGKRSSFVIKEPEPTTVVILENDSIGQPVANPNLEVLILTQQKLIEIYLEQLTYKLNESAALNYRLKLEHAEDLLSIYVKANTDLI